MVLHYSFNLHICVMKLSTFRFGHMSNPFINCLVMTAALSFLLNFFLLICLEYLHFLDVNLFMKICIANILPTLWLVFLFSNIHLTNKILFFFFKFFVVVVVNP